MALAGFACCNDGRLATYGECHDIWRMSKRKTHKAGRPTDLPGVGRRLGTVYGETKKEALANAQKEFAQTEAEKKRIYLRSQ